MLLAVFLYRLKSVEVFFLLLSEASDCLLDLQSLLFILLEERINIKRSWEVKRIVDLFECLSCFIICDSIYLKEKCFGSLFDPTMFLNPNNLTLLIAVVINMRNGYFFTSLIEFSIFDVDHKQTKELIFGFVNLNIDQITPSFSLIKTFSILPMNC